MVKIWCKKLNKLCVTEEKLSSDTCKYFSEVKFEGGFTCENQTLDSPLSRFKPKPKEKSKILFGCRAMEKDKRKYESDGRLKFHAKIELKKDIKSE